MAKEMNYDEICRFANEINGSYRKYSSTRNDLLKVLGNKECYALAKLLTTNPKLIQMYLTMVDKSSFKKRFPIVFSTDDIKIPEEELKDVFNSGNIVYRD